MKKKIVTAILVFVLVLTIVAPLTVFADWIKEEYSFGGETYASWSYKDDSGELVTGWQYIGGKWYYFGPNGTMYSDGIYEIGGKSYYFYPSGAMGTGWIARTFANGDSPDYTAWYYAGSSGALVSDWLKIGAVWYYFAPDSHLMYCDGTYSIGGKTYFFDKNGAMGTGWCKYSVEYEDGYVSEFWYYADSSGALQRGWKKIGGVWYYLNDRMYTGTAFIDGEMQAFDGNGAWTTKPGWMEVKSGTYSTWYYLDAKGKPCTGWKKIGGVWYYFNNFYGEMYSDCSHYIDGKYYAFNKSGAWISGTGWYKISDYDATSRWIYVKDGVVQTGWQEIGGVWYYLPYNGMMVTGNQVIDGVVEEFGSSGAWLGTSEKTGWIKIGIDNRWVYVEDDEGTLATGWRTIDGITYYFESYNCYMAFGDLYEIDDEYYCFDRSGALRTGFITNDYDRVYYANDEGVVQAGWQEIDGYQCYFHPYGFWMFRGGTYEIDGEKYDFDASGRLMAE